MGIKLNFTQQEASSEAFELLPKGWYKAAIVAG